MNSDIKSKNLIAREINKKIKKSGYESGFPSVGILAIDDLKTLNNLPKDYNDYLLANMYGDMTYLEKKLQFFQVTQLIKKIHKFRYKKLLRMKPKF